MLETLFIWCLILLPLGIAVVLIAYRARFFLIGVIGVIALMMLVWAGLRFAAMFDEGPAQESPDMRSGRAPAPLDGAGSLRLSFDMRIAPA